MYQPAVKQGAITVLSHSVSHAQRLYLSAYKRVTCGHEGGTGISQVWSGLIVSAVT